MAALPKAIIKKYGMTKKAWAVFRASKKKGGKVKVKRVKRVKARRVVVSSSKAVKPMAKRKKRSVRRVARRVARRVGVAMDTKPGKVVMAALEATGGAVVTSMVVNKVPVIRDQGRTVKSLVQGGTGLAAIMFVRNRHVKALGAGAVIAAIMGLVKETLKLEPLAGPSAGSRTLTPSEMAAITSGQMGIPFPSNGQMGVPMSQASSNAGFGRVGFGS